MKERAAIILRLVRDAGADGISTAELSERLRITPKATTHVVDKLVGVVSVRFLENKSRWVDSAIAATVRKNLAAQRRVRELEAKRVHNAKKRAERAALREEVPREPHRGIRVASVWELARAVE